MTRRWIAWLLAASGAALVVGACASSHVVATPTAPSSSVSTPAPEATVTAAPVTPRPATPLPATPAPRGGGLFDASFVSANEGWLVRRDASSTASEVLATSDGGVSWARQYINDDLVPSVIEFVDASNGWVVGRTGGQACRYTAQPNAFAPDAPPCHGVLVETHDRGAHWSESMPGGSDIVGVAFGSAHDGSLLLRTTCLGCENVSLSLLRTRD